MEMKKLVVNGQEFTVKDPSAQDNPATKDLNMNGHKVECLMSLHFSGTEPDQELQLVPVTSVANEAGEPDAAVLEFQGGSEVRSGYTVLRCIRDGVLPYDAATVSQVRAVDLTKEKSLTAEQKKQARDNIGAVDGAQFENFSDYVNDSVVFYSEVQNLTEEQKLQARRNIGAASYQTVDVLEQDMERVLQVTDFAVTAYAQNLSESQKAQARDNIDAASMDYIDEHTTKNVVWFSKAQNLTEQQKRQARYNIGAISNNDEVSALNFTGKLSTDDGANVQFNGNILHGTGTPEVDTDAANKGYVDEAIATAIANLPVYNGEVEEV